MSNPERVVGKKAKVVEVKPNNSNCGGFQPFQREKKRVFSESNDPQPAAVKAVDSAPAVKAVASAPAPATTTSSTTETCGVVGKGGEEHIHQQQSQTQSQTRRKQRRCWSPELHRRFLHALQQLGGSHGKRFNYLFSDWLSFSNL